MLKLKQYSFSGIGRFVEKQTIDLESRSHLIQIDGENTNTGGSSGAGKSTTVEALAFLLGISDIPSTQLQSRITKSPIWVQGEFEGGITITRSKKDGLTIETPEGTVSGNSKLAEEKLDEIIGVDRNLLKTMCYKRQKQGGFFLNLTPKQSHEFLVQCLDLGRYQDKIGKMNDLLKEQYKPKKIELESGVVEIQNTIQELKDYLDQKEKPVKDVRLDIWDEDELNLNIDVLEQALYSENKKYNDNIASLGSKPEPVESESKALLLSQVQNIETEITALKQKMHNNYTQKEQDVQQMTSAIYKIQKKIDNANNLKIKAIEKETEMKKLQEQYQHIEAGTCPTCSQNWTSEEKLVELRYAIADIGMEINACKDAVGQIPHYIEMKEKAELLLKNKINTSVNEEETKKIDELQSQKTELNNQISNLDKEYLKAVNDYNQKHSTLTSLYNEKANEIVKEITAKKSEITQIQTVKKAYQDAVMAYEADVNAMMDKISILNHRFTTKQIELKEIENNVILAEESIRLIKNYTLQKFQDTLNYIGNRASQIINMIPNMANAVISFENAKQTKTGSIKNEVNAIINLEGDSKVPIKTLSGGERTSADFAVDLAVGEMIESMTQKGVNFLIIDEGFDGLDSISKIECLEILKSLNTDKKILMVDHSSEVKEMVYDIIKVRRINEESFVA
jgi:DNA repair exonuclease SbcCD ATPase subunit